MWFIIWNNCTNESIRQWYDFLLLSNPKRNDLWCRSQFFTYDFFLFLTHCDLFYPIYASVLLLRRWTVKISSRNFSCFKFSRFYLLRDLVAEEKESWKSCNFPQSSIILSHQIEGERNSSYCFYIRCQKAAKINWKWTKRAREFNEFFRLTKKLHFVFVGNFNEINFHFRFYFQAQFCQVCSRIVK